MHSNTLELAYVKNRENENDSSNGFSYKVYKKLVLPLVNEIRVVPFESIYYLEANGNYTSVNLNDESSILVSKTMKALFEKLDSSFLRVHQSFSINLLHISSFDLKNSCINMKNGTKVPVSRRHRSILRKKLVNQR